MEKFVDEDTKGPYISFGSILMKEQAFRTHIDGTTDVDILEGMIRFDSKTKVSDF
jgi:hypothetical protein